jgi:hypothetical protein
MLGVGDLGGELRQQPFWGDELRTDRAGVMVDEQAGGIPQLVQADQTLQVPAAGFALNRPDVLDAVWLGR